MREEIKSLINTDPLPSLLYWNSILNYFEKHRPDLELDDLKALADESERCRMFWNEDREVIETVYKNGKYIEIPTIVRSLNIAQDEVNPDVVWYYNQLLSIEQQKETQRLARLVAEMPKDETPEEEWAHNLATDLCRFGD